MKKLVVINLLWILGTLFSSSLYALFQDPTRPPDNLGEGMTSSSFTLSAIVKANDRLIAIIDGQTLREGEKISGESVVSIEENKVQLEGPSGRITLFLFSEPLKDSGEIGCNMEENAC